MTVDGAPVDTAPSSGTETGAGGATELVFPTGTDVPLTLAATSATEPPDDIAWFSSTGTLHDFDLPTAYFRLEPEEDLPTGELVVVRRDSRGGVAWRSWPFRTEQ
jgi:hypothetical protein